MTPLLVLTNQTATLAVGTNDADPGHVRGARARQVHLHTAAVVHGVDALALRTPSLGIELRTSLRQSIDASLALHHPLGVFTPLPSLHHAAVLLLPTSRMLDMSLTSVPLTHFLVALDVGVQSPFA